METSRREKAEAPEVRQCEVCCDDARPGRRTCGKPACAGALGAEERIHPTKPTTTGYRQPRRYDGEGRVLRPAKPSSCRPRRKTARNGVSPEKRARILKAAAEGLSVRTVAVRFGLAMGTVQRMIGEARRHHPIEHGGEG